MEVPTELIDNASPLWEDFVIARFLETAPHVAKVHIFGEKDLGFWGKRSEVGCI